MKRQYLDFELDDDALSGETSGAGDRENDDLEEMLPPFPIEEDSELFGNTAELAETMRGLLEYEYQSSSTDAIEEALFDMLESMPPVEGFSFTKALQSVGDAGLRVISDPNVTQMAGMGLGTLIGGPIGASVGSKLGQAAGSGLQGATGKPALPKITPSKPLQVSAAQSAALAPVAGGSPAATQLLSLTQNPDFVKGLLSAALLPYANKSIKIGQQGPEVSLSAMMTMLSTLAGQAAAEAEEYLSGGEELTGYLVDSEGVFQVDPVVPEERAKALYQAFVDAEEDRLFGEDAPQQTSIQPWADFFPFGKGTVLLVEYETRIRDFNIGKAVVQVHTPTELRLKIHIDEKKRFNVEKTDAILAIEYIKEGSGNQAAVNVNGQAFSDKNVEIRSNGNTREIRLSISILGQSVDSITLTRKSQKKARLTFKTQGSAHTLLLSPD